MSSLPTIDGPPSDAVDFGPLSIAFDRRVLRPRPWTVRQATWAAHLMSKAPERSTVLELCAGAGQIGLLALALTEARQHRLVAIDVNPAACEFARRNAATAGLAERVEIRQGRLDHAVRLQERFAVVIADPPWVPRSETDRFPEDPLLAIDGGDDGLVVAFSCLAVAATHLTAGGSMLLQLGSLDQADRVDGFLHDQRKPLVVVEVEDTEQGGVLVQIDRVTSAVPRG